MFIIIKWELNYTLIIKEPEKNPDTGKLEIMIKFTADEIDMLNGVRYGGDKDDPKQAKIMDDLKEGIYQARRKISPSLSV